MIYMSAINLIGICGQEGRDKEVVVNYLIEEWGFAPYFFSRCLEDMDKELIHFSKENHRKDFGYLKKADFVFITMQYTSFSDMQTSGMVISDVYYEHEADWVREHEGHILHVCRQNDKHEMNELDNVGISIQEYDSIIFESVSHEYLSMKVDDALKSSAFGFRFQAPLR